MKSQKDNQADIKADVEKLAIMTASEFSVVHQKFGALDEKVDSGFIELRNEMRDGFKAILAAVETVEYTKLRLRIETLEDNMEKVKTKVGMKNG